ncbi:DUF5694 domain-containing protein [Robiginitalea sp. SC105]|uniref:DUF5694 domain-containing protein n=1 Tax=Robiginitalea sp. SC105 TaxID=2762332 RepID=UPI00163AAFFC|nr:DUF5694 domain-containing protein [Robiginitalea sp. SC105]MBC2839804.1 hypothetical protein [Robiginitalea sp. SC105]
MKTNPTAFIAFLLVLLTGFQACRTEPEPSQESLPNPSSYFPESRAQVLVVGSFHFDYPGLDAMQTADSDKIDVLEEPRSSELTAFIEYLEKFKPNKIAIEAFPRWEAMRKYREYREGQHREERDERFQIAMRLADRFDLDTLYAVDAESVYDDWYERDSAYVSALGADYDFRSDDPYDSIYHKWFQEDQKALITTGLKEYFLYMNSPESHRYGYGAYLTGDFKLGEFRGSDMLALYWYSRNLRIFRNLQRAAQSDQDRILLVIGNGHAAVLRQLLEASPEFHFVELSEL